MFSFSWFKGKSYEDELHDFEEKINSVATSLIKTSEENLPQGQYDLASLMNPDVCNDYVIFLGSELEKRFKKVEIEEINTAIFIGKRKKYSQKKNNNMDELDYSTDKAKFNKKDLCQKVASHYIRMLNLVSAILSAVSPDKNVCSRRIKALYDSISTDVESGFVKVCPSDDTDISNLLYPENISELPGIKQLLNLYYFYLLQDVDPSNEAEKKKIKIEFEKLQESFNAVFTSSLVKPKHIPVELHETEKKINQALESVLSVNQQPIMTLTPSSKKQEQTDAQLETMTNLLFDLKNQIDTLKSQNKGGQITQENIQQLQSSILDSMKHQINDIKGDFTTQMTMLQDKVNTIVSEKAQQMETELKNQMPVEQIDLTGQSDTESYQGESDIDVESSGEEGDIDLSSLQKPMTPQQLTPSLVSVLQKTPSSESEITTMKDYLSTPSTSISIQPQVNIPMTPSSSSPLDTPGSSSTPMDTPGDSPFYSPSDSLTPMDTPMDTPSSSSMQTQVGLPSQSLSTQKGGQTPKISPIELGTDTRIDGAVVGIVNPAVLPSKINYNTPLQSSETPDSPDGLDSPQLSDSESDFESSSMGSSIHSDSGSDSGSDSESSGDEDIFTSPSPIQTKSVKPTPDILMDTQTPIQTTSVAPTTDILMNPEQHMQTISVKPTNDMLIGSPTQVETEKSSASYGAENIAPVVSSLLDQQDQQDQQERPVILEGVITPEQHSKLLSSVESFIEFVDKYSNQYKMDDNFSFDLRPKTNEEIVEHFKCNNEPSSLTIKINDKEFYEFKKAYQRLKQHYLDSTKELLSVLENKIIDKTAGNPFESEYKLRAVSNTQLNDIQIDVMRKLTLFYTRCQDYYQLAFSKLAESVKSIDEKDKNNLPK